jgi:hypothetical protein
MTKACLAPPQPAEPEREDGAPAALKQGLRLERARGGRAGTGQTERGRVRLGRATAGRLRKQGSGNPRSGSATAGLRNRRPPDHACSRPVPPGAQSSCGRPGRIPAKSPAGPQRRGQHGSLHRGRLPPAVAPPSRPGSLLEARLRVLRRSTGPTIPIRSRCSSRRCTKVPRWLTRSASSWRRCPANCRVESTRPHRWMLPCLRPAGPNPAKPAQWPPEGLLRRSPEGRIPSSHQKIRCRFLPPLSHRILHRSPVRQPALQRPGPLPR